MRLEELVQEIQSNIIQAELGLRNSFKPEVFAKDPVYNSLIDISNAVDDFFEKDINRPFSVSNDSCLNNSIISKISPNLNSIFAIAEDINSNYLLDEFYSYVGDYILRPVFHLQESLGSSDLVKFNLAQLYLNLGSDLENFPPSVNSRQVERLKSYLEISKDYFSKLSSDFLGDLDGYFFDKIDTIFAFYSEDVSQIKSLLKRFSNEKDPHYFYLRGTLLFEKYLLGSSSDKDVFSAIDNLEIALKSPLLLKDRVDCQSSLISAYQLFYSKYSFEKVISHMSSLYNLTKDPDILEDISDTYHELSELDPEMSSYNLSKSLDFMVLAYLSTKNTYYLERISSILNEGGSDSGMFF